MQSNRKCAKLIALSKNYNMGLIKLSTVVKKKRHRLRNWLIGIVSVIVVALLVAGSYFFTVAMVPSHKSFVHQSSSRISRTDPLYRQKTWFADSKKQHWTIESATRHYRLDADYIPAAHSTTRSVIILHGFMGRKEDMGAYAAMYHQLGYNVLLPDARAHGHSQGKYIGYGWPERYDVRKWAEKLIAKNGTDSQIVIAGTSMGGATTMMTSGIKLPHQVKAFVEDCGYTSLNDELNYEAGNLYHIPTFLRCPLIAILSGINWVHNGFFTGEANSVKMLHNNTRPMLFIHGSDDTFVPTKMVYQNYAASRGPKELWVVSGAKHAASFAHSPRAYQQHVRAFLQKYVK